MACAGANSGVNLKCEICLSNIELKSICEEEKPGFLVCSHVFHNGCIGEWLKEKNTCPICRTRVSVISDDNLGGGLAVVPNILDTLITRRINSCAMNCFSHLANSFS